MVALGTRAPEFRLPDIVSGETISLDTFAGKKAVLVMFLSRHCPYVQHVKDEIARIALEYSRRGVGFVAISSNDIVTYPDDAPEKLKEMAEETGLSFPFCFDENQQVAREYHAACTPDFFLFDQQRRLAYRGQLDDSRPGNRNPVTGKDIRRALEAILAGKPVPGEQKASMGCSIKWKSGDEPE
jgi:peroxiredoxin